MSRFVVTGGGGFIGSNLVEALLRRGEHVRAVDDFSTGRRANLDAVAEWARAGSGSFELLEGDLRDVAVCAAAVRDADFVLHKAAIPSVQRSVQDPIETNDVNVRGTLQLLVAARDAKVRRFVFASSSSVYGESEVLPKVETMPSAPISPYGLQKLAGEQYVLLFHRLYGLPTVALRYFNVFGPRQDPASDYAAVVPRFLDAVRSHKAPIIYGDGEQTRDFTYVTNVVAANLLACAGGAEVLGRAYNIACGQRISLNALLGELGAIAGRTIVARHDPERPGDIRHSLAQIDLAKELLGFTPSVTLREGLEKLWAEPAR